LKTLLDADADPHAPPSPKGGTSTLIALFKAGNPKIIHLLFEESFNPKCAWVDQSSAVGEAVAQNSTELVVLLINAAANIDECHEIFYDSTNRGTVFHGTPSELAARNGNLEIATVKIYWTRMRK